MSDLFLQDGTDPSGGDPVYWESPAIRLYSADLGGTPPTDDQGSYFITAEQDYDVSILVNNLGSEVTGVTVRTYFGPLATTPYDLALLGESTGLTINYPGTVVPVTTWHAQSGSPVLLGCLVACAFTPGEEPSQLALGDPASQRLVAQRNATVLTFSEAGGGGTRAVGFHLPGFSDHPGAMTVRAELVGDAPILHRAVADLRRRFPDHSFRRAAGVDAGRVGLLLGPESGVLRRSGPGLGDARIDNAPGTGMLPQPDALPRDLVATEMKVHAAADQVRQGILYLPWQGTVPGDVYGVRVIQHDHKGRIRGGMTVIVASVP